MVICFPSGAQSVGGIPSGSELLHLFPLCRINRAGQILFLEFIKNGLEDLGDVYTYGDLANQPVTLQAHVDFHVGVSALLPV